MQTETPFTLTPHDMQVAAVALNHYHHILLENAKRAPHESELRAMRLIHAAHVADIAHKLEFGE